MLGPPMAIEVLSGRGEALVAKARKVTRMAAKARMSANLVERIVGVRVGWAALGKRGWGRSR